MDVLRVGGQVALGAEHAEFKRIHAHFLESLNQKVGENPGHVSAHEVSYSIHAKGPIVLLLRRRLAAQPLGFGGIVTAGKSIGNDFVEDESYTSTQRDQNVGMHIEDNGVLFSNPNSM